MNAQETLKFYTENFSNLKYADIEVYEPQFSNTDYHALNLHTDFIKSVEFEDVKNREVLTDKLLNEEDYNNSILANCGLSLNFEEVYGNKNAKVLVILVKKENQI